MVQDDYLTNRRSVLFATLAGASSLAGCTEPFNDQATPTDEETPEPAPEEGDPRIEEGDWATGDMPLYRLVARNESWVGQGPESVTDVENPPLRMREGTEYEVIWENRDGERHQLVIADSDGEPVASTEPAGARGEVRSVVITASDDLEEYYCDFHADSARGEVRVGAEGLGNN